MKLVRTHIMALACMTIAAGIGMGAAAAQAEQVHKTKISRTYAESAALKKYRGGKLQGKTELENEDGKWQYAVMVRANGKIHEVMVDGNTGKIASEETVTAKEEAAEKRAETAHKAHSKTKK